MRVLGFLGVEEVKRSDGYFPTTEASIVEALSASPPVIAGVILEAAVLQQLAFPAELAAVLGNLLRTVHSRAVEYRRHSWDASDMRISSSPHCRSMARLPTFDVYSMSLPSMRLTSFRHFDLFFQKNMNSNGRSNVID